jgi:transposase
MRILAIDLGKYKAVCVAYDSASGKATYSRLQMTVEEMEAILDSVLGSVEVVVVENGPSAGWVTDLAAARQMKVLVANTNHAAWKWTNVQCKNDRKDALKLAKMTAAGSLPTVHMPRLEVRQKRQLIEYRAKLQDRRTAVCNSIHAILQMAGVAWTHGKSAWIQERRLELSTMAWPLDTMGDGELWRGQLCEELSSLEQVEEHLEAVETKLNLMNKKDPQVQLVKTIEGVGDRLGEALVAVLDDPHRFKTGKQVGSYVGLTPRLFESGQVSRNGHITKAGNPLLRKLLVCVSWLSLRHNPHLAEIYRRTCRGQKNRRKIAIVAVARRLLVIAWAMLRDGTKWRRPSVPEVASAAAGG